MNSKLAALMLMLSAASSLSAALPASAETDFGKSQPSVKDIVDSLKEDDVAPGVRTRSLRPGAAAEATSAAVAEPASAPSISMQIQFDYASDRISAPSKKIMNNLAAALSSSELQSQSFTIVGHTDGRGAPEYNMALSQRRAASVKAYLVSNGVDAERLKTVGKGLTELANKDNPAAAENRRVEIVAGG